MNKNKEWSENECRFESFLFYFNGTEFTLDNALLRLNFEEVVIPSLTNIAEVLTKW